VHIILFWNLFKKQHFCHKWKNLTLTIGRTYAEYFKGLRKGSTENRVCVRLTEWIFDLRFAYKIHKSFDLKVFMLNVNMCKSVLLQYGTSRHSASLRRSGFVSFTQFCLTNAGIVRPLSSMSFQFLIHNHPIARPGAVN
jgi:hypothetical protein